jgi:hypothetical protein
VCIVLPALFVNMYARTRVPPLARRLPLNFIKFQQVASLSVFVSENEGGEQTSLQSTFVGAHGNGHTRAQPESICFLVCSAALFTASAAALARRIYTCVCSSTPTRFVLHPLTRPVHFRLPYFGCRPPSTVCALVSIFAVSLTVHSLFFYCFFCPACAVRLHPRFQYR